MSNDAQRELLDFLGIGAEPAAKRHLEARDVDTEDLVAPATLAPRGEAWDVDLRTLRRLRALLEDPASALRAELAGQGFTQNP